MLISKFVSFQFIKLIITSYMIIKLDNKKVVGVVELNTTIQQLSESLVNDVVHIHFTNPIDRIKIIFIAGLFLCHKEFSIQFKIHCFSIEVNKYYYQIRQYLKQIMDLYGGGNSFLEFEQLRSYNNEGNYSASFIPLLYITEENYKSFFVDVSSPFDKVIGTIYLNNLRESRDNNAEAAFWASYHTDINHIYNKLLGKSLIFKCLYTILYKKVRPFSFVDKDSDRKNVGLNRAESIFAFVDAYVVGLNELAKNIIQHTERACGIISVNIVDSEDALKSLESYVIDFGKEGVVPKLLFNTLDNYRKIDDLDTMELYDEDSKIIKEGYGLKDFIEPTPKTQLHQQLARELAHYGIMEFVDLIKQNSGKMSICSCGLNDVEDSYLYEMNDSNENICIGTSYYFVLPILGEETATDANRRTYHFKPDMLGADYSQSLSKLFDYKVYENDLPENVSGGIIYNLRLKSIEILCREDESSLFAEIKSLRSLAIVKSFSYLAIDMGNVQYLSASGLLRFCACLTRLIFTPCVIYNVSTDVFHKMLKLNELYTKTTGDNNVPYWYKDKAILIYSTLDKPKFYFADMMYGMSKSDLVAINTLISHSYPNTVTANMDNPMGEFEDLLGDLPAYFQERQLLPFDLILKDSSGEALFYTNLKYLLNKIIS